MPLINHDRAVQVVEHGDRIAQLLLARVVHVRWQETDALPDSERGAGGFGSTGR